MQIKNKRVLFTGSCGFIGQTFGRILLQENPSDILCIDKMSYASDNSFYLQNKIHLMECDISDTHINKWVVRFKPDIIINMAAESHVDNSIKDPMPFLKSNVEGVMNLLNCCLEMKEQPLFVQISTDEVLGDNAEGFSKEEDPRHSSSPYSASKAAAEHFVEAYGRTYKIPYLITRSSNNYGPYQHTEKFIPKTISNLLTGIKVPIYGNGLQERDWIHVEDNCNGIFAAIKNSDNGNRIYHVGGNKSITNISIVKKLCSLLNKDFDSSVEYVTDRLGHDKRYALDTSLLQGIGWKQEITLDSGLLSTVEWYKEKQCLH